MAKGGFGALRGDEKSQGVSITLLIEIDANDCLAEVFPYQNNSFKLLIMSLELLY